MENLRYFLNGQNTSKPVYFGCKFKKYVKQGYMSGGAGYVLSREAVKRLVEIALPNKTLCSNSNRGSEDVEMGKCLESVHVEAGDSRDNFGRGRFFPFVPEHHLIPPRDRNFWFLNFVYYDPKFVRFLNNCFCKKLIISSMLLFRVWNAVPITLYHFITSVRTKCTC